MRWSLVLILILAPACGGSPSSSDTCNGQSAVRIWNNSTHDMIIYFDGNTASQTTINIGLTQDFAMTTGHHEADAGLIGDPAQVGCQGDWAGTNGALPFELGCVKPTLVCQ